jgi:DNA primase
MASTVEKIKDRLGVVDVISKYLRLEKAGLNYRARCPFHNEKTPSFFVSPARGSWHCFGCNKGGDILSFVEEIEGVDFIGALKILAPWAGVELESYDRGDNEEKNRLLTILDKATDFFSEELAGAPGALDYLKSRGLTEETIRSWRLGLAPALWRHASDKLNQLGFKDEEMEQTGLLVKPASGAGIKGQRFYERFRSRLMFPIFDPAGRVVGFSGRIFNGKEDEAKYINTPETTLYDKSRLLYGYDRAKLAIRAENRAVLVEGQMDLVLSHQAGVTEAVAVSGTALTIEHLRQLKRLTDNLVMSFDQDLAGINAARRAVDMALALGFEVKAALLPAGQDPADVIKANPQQFKTAVDEAKHIIDFYLAVLGRAGHSPRELNRLVSREVAPYVKRLPNALDQAHFVTKIASFLNVPEEPVWAEVRRVAVAPVETTVVDQAVKVPTTRAAKLERVLFGLLLWQDNLAEKLIDPAELEKKVSVIVGEEELGTKKSAYRALGQELMFEVELAYAGAKNLTSEVEELLNDYRRERLKDELTATLTLLKQAEAAGDAALLDRYMKKCQDISTALNQINH